MFPFGMSQKLLQHAPLLPLQNVPPGRAQRELVVPQQTSAPVQVDVPPHRHAPASEHSSGEEQEAPPASTWQPP